MRDFALRSEIDLKYLVDGANFVISMLHFNPDNNFYVTLGISGKASADEIRERWKKLMLLYHPDRQADNIEWFAERAKKVNEAYSTLKDALKRAAFDKKLAEDSFRRQSSRLRAAAPARAGMHRVATHHSVRRGSSSGKGANLRRYLPVVIVVCYIAVAAVFIAYMNSPNKSASLESELQPVRDAVISTSSVPVPPPSGAEGGALGMRTAEKPAADNERKAAAGKIPLNGPARDTSASQKHAGPLEQGIPLHAANEPAPAKEETPGRHAAGQAAPLQQKKTVMTEVSTERNIEEERKKEPQAEAAPVVTRSEVEDFLRRYTESYKGARLDEFLKFFSKRAIENGRMGYAMIRDSYKRTFSARIAMYQLNNVVIRIDGRTARVSGLYTVGRYSASGERMRNHSGRISWTIAKEDNALKILEADYDD